MQLWLESLSTAAAEKAALRELATVRAAEATGQPGALGHAYVGFRKWVEVAMSWRPEIADLYCFMRLQLYRQAGTQAESGEGFVRIAAKQILDLTEESAR